jgi:serine/threonine-protein phosphatase 2A regulatory subunit B''
MSTAEKPDSAAAAQTEESNKALLAQSWVKKLKKYNENQTHKTAAENDREADIEFLKLLEDEKTKEEERNASYKTIPRFFYKKPSNENSLFFKVRQEARTRFL